MSFVLAINCGSSSVKYRLYDMETETALARGLVERIGEAASAVLQETLEERAQWQEPVPDYERAFDLLTRHLEHPRLPPSARDLTAVGHRVVHGGAMVEPTVVKREVLAAIREAIDLAPLHNPANLAGIEVAQQHFPGTVHVAVFDTWFHRHLPPRAYLYALPYEMFAEHGLRRYGFHGTSHRWAAQQAAVMLDRDPGDARLIICHLGNGCSLAAVERGAAVDTSMGLTPLEGVPMGARSGDVDPGIFGVLHRRLGLSVEQIEEMLNHRSGLLGLSGVSNDVRAIEQAAAAGDHRAALCLEVFTYRVTKQIGAYLAALGGADAVVFTGGIGEHAAQLRARICAGLEWAGLKLEAQRNRDCAGQAAVISADGSAIAALVIPSHEELLIARDALQVARAAGRGSGRAIS